MKGRINLFNPLLRERLNPQKSTTVKVAKPFKLTFRIAVSLVASILFLVSFIPAYLNYKTLVSENTKKAEEFESKINETTKQAEEQVARIQELRRKEAEKNREVASNQKGVKIGAPKDVAAIDHTWTSVLWSLSTFTSQQIVIEKLELTRPGSSSAELGVSRMVTLEGNATSLKALQNWIEVLSVNMPSADFFLDRQSKNTKDMKNNIVFKLTARFS